MKIFFYLIMFFIIISCVNNNQVYWCGDHPCINKKEKESYFRKTMVVEIKDLKKENFDNKSEIEKIMQQAKYDEKNRIKKEKNSIKENNLEKKKTIIEEKKLAKQIQLDEKKRAREEKKMAKQVELDEKKRAREEKKMAKQVELDKKIKIKKEKKIATQQDSQKKTIYQAKSKSGKNVINIDGNIGILKININKFDDLVDKIIKRNSLRSYPDINFKPN